MYNEKLLYLLCVEKLAPGHIKDNPPSQCIGLSIMLFKFSPAVVVGLRQSLVYNQNLDFQLNFKSKLGKPIHLKKIIHLLNLKELHLEHISALTGQFLPLDQRNLKINFVLLATCSNKRKIIV